MADPTTEIDDDWLVVDDDAGSPAESIMAPKDPAATSDLGAAIELEAPALRRPRPPPLPPSARSASSIERASEVVARPDAASWAVGTAEVDADWFSAEEPNAAVASEAAVTAEVGADWFSAEEPNAAVASEAAVTAEVDADWFSAEEPNAAVASEAAVTAEVDADWFGAEEPSADVGSGWLGAEAPSAAALRQPVIPRAPRIPGPADLPGPLIPDLDLEEIQAALAVRRSRESGS